MRKRSPVACLILLLLSPFAVPGEGGDGEEWPTRAVFDDLERRYGETPVSAVEDGSTLAWGRSYGMRARVTAYRATEDVGYLRRLLEEAEAVAALRDDRRDPPLRDEIRDRVVPAWSTPRYTEGRRYAWAVHTGMITAPILEGLLLARDRKEKDGVFAPERRAALLRACREAVDAHDDQWRDGPANGEGHLFGLSLGKPLPLNMQNALGRAHVWLFRLTEEEVYRRRARALLAFLKNRMRRDGNAYVWSYWPPLDGRGTGFEDVSHGAINADFAVLGAGMGWVFDESDLARLRSTLTTRILAGPAPADTVGGEGTTGKFSSQLGRWLPLAGPDGAAWTRIRDWFRDRDPPGPTGNGLLTVALLLRHRPR